MSLTKDVINESEWLTLKQPHLMLRQLFYSWEDCGNLGTDQVPRNRPLISPRKMRLYLCAVCRQAQRFLVHPDSRNAVDVAERFADGWASDTDRASAYLKASMILSDPPASSTRYAELMARYCVRDTIMTWYLQPGCYDYPCPPADQADILRSVAGNPYRPRLPLYRRSDHDDRLMIDSPRVPWLTPQAFSLALAAYENRTEDFALDEERLAVLADCLEEEGCDDAEILSYLRKLRYRVSYKIGDSEANSLGLFLTLREAFSVAASLCRHGLGQADVYIEYEFPPRCRGDWVLDLILGKE